MGDLNQNETVALSSDEPSLKQKKMVKGEKIHPPWNKAVESEAVLSEDNGQNIGKPLFRGKFPSFQSVLELVRKARDLPLLIDIENNVKLVNYSSGKIEFELASEAPNDLVDRFRKFLRNNSDDQWEISVVYEGGQETMAEKRKGAYRKFVQSAKENVVVKSVLKAFPGATIKNVIEYKTLDSGDLVDKTENSFAPGDNQWEPFEEEQ